MLDSSVVVQGGETQAIKPRMHPVLPGARATRGIRHEESSLANAKSPGQSGADEIQSIATIVDRARGGDPEAFRAIFLRYGKPVLGFLFHLLGDRACAEEMAQETFFRAFRGLERMQDGVRLSTWLFGIARNVAREAVRDRRRSAREVDLDDAVSRVVHDERADPAETFITVELQRAIRRSMADLSEDQRVVFVLKVMNKMRYQEIALITGSSVGKLKTDLHRARESMRRNLQPYLAGRVPGM